MQSTAALNSVKISSHHPEYSTAAKPHPTCWHHAIHRCSHGSALARTKACGLQKLSWWAAQTQLMGLQLCAIHSMAAGSTHDGALAHKEASALGAAPRELHLLDGNVQGTRDDASHLHTNTARPRHIACHRAAEPIEGPGLAGHTKQLGVVDMYDASAPQLRTPVRLVKHSVVTVSLHWPQSTPACQTKTTRSSPSSRLTKGARTGIHA